MTFRYNGRQGEVNLDGLADLNGCKEKRVWSKLF